MALLAPMIGQVTRRIFYDTDAEAGIMQCLPKGGAGFALMRCFADRAPVDGLERDVAHMIGIEEQDRIYC